eukprot:334326_1
MTFAVHTLMLQSLDPEAMKRPDGEYETDITADLCPTNLNASNDGYKFQTITILSDDPDANCCVDGWKDILWTGALCPRNDRSNLGSNSSTFIVFCSDASNYCFCYS